MQPRGPSPPVDPNRLHVALVEAVFSARRVRVRDGRVGCWSFVVVQGHQAVDVAAKGTEFAELVEAGDEESGVDRAGHVRGDSDLCHDGNIAHV